MKLSTSSATNLEINNNILIDTIKEDSTDILPKQRKPKKTKTSNEESSTTPTTTATTSDELEEQTTSTTMAPQPALSTTGAFEDGSVLQSDLKSIKQSAVKMSVGQKQEASQILSIYLIFVISEHLQLNIIEAVFFGLFQSQLNRE